LTISRSLVQLEGGKMWVESTEGFGSSFYFTITYLPVMSEDVNFFKTDFSKSNEDKPFTGKSVILVERNHLKFDYFQKLILATGAMVFKAENLQQCYDIMLQHNQINMIIMDATLFDKGEYNNLRQLKNEYDNLSLVLIISDKEEKYSDLLQNNLFDMTLQVPVRYVDILKMMDITG